jgi:hypothetical protein
MADRLSEALELNEWEDAVLRAAAVDDAGLDHPAKHGRAVA